MGKDKKFKKVEELHNKENNQELENQAEFNEYNNFRSEEDDKFSELEEKLDNLSDRHLRLQAEFDNFRKRTLKEKADLLKSGGESLIIDLLPVIDDFDRAIDNIEDIDKEDSHASGILLIYNKFKEFLKKNNVTEIDALGKDFDLDLHDAVTKIPAPDEDMKGKIIDVLEKGYLLNGKVIRYAKVVIGE